MAKQAAKQQTYRPLARVICKRCGKRTYRGSLRGQACVDCRDIPEPARCPNCHHLAATGSLIERAEVITARWGIEVRAICTYCQDCAPGQQQTEPGAA